MTDLAMVSLSQKFLYLLLVVLWLLRIIIILVVQMSSITACQASHGKSCCLGVSLDIKVTASYRQTLTPKRIECGKKMQCLHISQLLLSLGEYLFPGKPSGAKCHSVQ